MKRLALTLIALSSSALAQGINVDIGTALPVPSPLFRGGAFQPGVWNKLWLPSGNTAPLVNLDGTPSAVTITHVAGVGGPFSFNNPNIFGDEQSLMEDGEAFGQLSTWRIDGLSPGSYDVYTYAWSPDSSSYITGVSVNGSAVQNIGGFWVGNLQQTLTYALDTVVVAAGSGIIIDLTQVTGFPTFNGVQIRPSGTIGFPYCYGNGPFPCPCGNVGVQYNGCPSSVAAGGAHLDCTGFASVSNDSLVLTTTQSPNGPALYFYGVAQNGVQFGDGLLCVGSGIVRIGVVFAAGNTSSYPGGLTPNPISTAGPTASGNIRDYQAWYRDADTGFCTTATFNTTNGLRLIWIP